MLLMKMDRSGKLPPVILRNISGTALNVKIKPFITLPTIITVKSMGSSPLYSSLTILGA